MNLQTFFAQNPRVALGFSGGVDSSYLLYAGHTCGADIRPYYIKTAFQPAFEREDAYRLCTHLGVQMTVLEHDVLTDTAVTSNPADRCYHCKTALFGLLQKHAAHDGYPVLIDGTNASDQEDDRPGMRALWELKVRSPLREAGLTKEEIRRLSREAGLFTWDKPAYACLATRVPTGRRLTADLLSRIEAAEDALFKLGFTNFRVRVYGEGARIQLPAAQLAQAMTQRLDILARLKPYFQVVLLDLETR